MAKGIDINGQLRGKRGGVVYYRANGQQISRVRNFAPANPKSNGQLIQRALTATSMKAYSQMKQILDHSFEGKRVGQESMSEFLRLNMSMLRTNLATDINNGAQDGEATVSVVNPKAMYPTLNSYIVSTGTLQNYLTQLVINGDNPRPGVSFAHVPAATTTVADYYAEYGISEGDIYTILVQGVVNLQGGFSSKYGLYASAPSTEFGFIRLIAKAASTETIVGKTLADLFEINSTNIPATCLTALRETTIAFNAETPVAAAVVDVYTPANGISGIAVIKSREDSKKRSFASFAFAGNNEITEVAPVGIKHWWLLNAWKDNSDSVGSSDLILEGGGF